MTMENLYGTPLLHEVFSVRQTGTANTFILDVELTDMNGERYRCNYVSAPDDDFGLAPAIRQWLADNEGQYTVAPYQPPTAEQVREAMPDLSARQLRLGLLNAGLIPSQVTAAIETLPAGPEKETAKVEWEYATTFRRLHPLIAIVGGVLGLTDEQIDAMWRAAVAL